MFEISLTKEQALELFVILNCKPNQLSTIEDVQNVVTVRNLLRDAGKQFVKTVEEYDLMLVDYQREAKDADDFRKDELKFMMNETVKQRQAFTGAHKKDKIKLKLEPNVLESLKQAFNVLGKDGYSQRSGGLEAFVLMLESINNAKALKTKE